MRKSIRIILSVVCVITLLSVSVFAASTSTSLGNGCTAYAQSGISMSGNAYGETWVEGASHFVSVSVHVTAYYVKNGVYSSTSQGNGGGYDTSTLIYTPTDGTTLYRVCGYHNAGGWGVYLFDPF